MDATTPQLPARSRTLLGYRTSLFAKRELAGSLHARWFLVYSAVFLAGGLLLATFGIGSTVVYGYRGFAKAFAGLVHLALVFVPLMALFPAAATIAEERDSGVLEYILAQPVTFAEVYLGKWAGISIAVLLSLTVGFGAAGAVAVLRGVPPGLIALLYGFVLLLSLSFVALGLLFSTLAKSRARAITFGIVVWFVFLALGTLGVIVAFVRRKPGYHGPCPAHAAIVDGSTRSCRTRPFQESALDRQSHPHPATSHHTCATRKHTTSPINNGSNVANAVHFALLVS